MAALFFLVICIGFSACKKPEEEIGIDLQPEEDILQTAAVDTFTIVAYTLLEDSVRTDKINPAPIGAYEDPVFGFAKASHITELFPSAENPILVPDSITIDDIVIDSLVLILRYPNVGTQTIGNLYGKQGPQFFRVFELADTLSVETTYYDLTQVSTVGNDLVMPGKNLQKIDFTNDVIIGDDTLTAQLRIPLKTELAQRFIEASVAGNLNRASFTSVFKGLKITVDEHQNFLQETGIPYFETGNAALKSNLRMYFKRLGSTQDTVNFAFVMEGNSGKFNQFEHDYSRAANPLFQQVVNNDRSFGNRDLYVQSMSGTKVRVELPTIANLNGDGNVAINKAELIIPARVDRFDIANNLFPPNLLFIFGVDSEERIFLLPDFGEGTINGNYDPIKKAYRFNITRYVQQVLLGSRENVPLEIVTSGAGSTANRVVLNGPDYPDAANPSNNMRLAITFTKF